MKGVRLIMKETITVDGKEFPVSTEKCDYFGLCPYCHDYDYYTNIGKAHWFVCKEHKVKWLAGCNLFSSWRDETEEDWEKNYEEIKAYEEVEPILPTYDELSELGE
jgi:hypothetical protein